jgi:hypothetical protein
MRCISFIEVVASRFDVSKGGIVSVHTQQFGNIHQLFKRAERAMAASACSP